MKIKQDFVTNSSSTSYLISVPGKVDYTNDIFFNLLEELMNIRLLKNREDFFNIFGLTDEDIEEYNSYKEVIDEIEKDDVTIIYFSIPYGGECTGDIEGVLKKFNGKMLMDAD